MVQEREHLEPLADLYKVHGVVTWKLLFEGSIRNYILLESMTERLRGSLCVHLDWFMGAWWIALSWQVGGCGAVVLRHGWPSAMTSRRSLLSIAVWYRRPTVQACWNISIRPAVILLPIRVLTSITISP